MKLDDTGDPKAPIIVAAIQRLLEQAMEHRAKAGELRDEKDNRADYWLGKASALESIASRLDTGGLDYLAGGVCPNCQRWNYHLASCPLSGYVGPIPTVTIALTLDEFEALVGAVYETRLDRLPFDHELVRGLYKRLEEQLENEHGKEGPRAA